MNIAQVCGEIHKQGGATQVSLFVAVCSSLVSEIGNINGARDTESVAATLRIPSGEMSQPWWVGNRWPRPWPWPSFPGPGRRSTVLPAPPTLPPARATIYMHKTNTWVAYASKY